MNGFDGTTEPERAPWKTIVLIVVAVAVAAALIVAAVLFVRSRSRVSVDGQYLARIESQLEQTLAGCANEPDPDACRAEKVRTAARATGTAGLCQYLEGESHDACVWTIAREQGDVAVCAGIEDGARAVECADALYLKQAASASDADVCLLVADEMKRNGCVEALADPITKEDCLARKDAAYCAQFDLYLAAAASQNPDLCAEITDADVQSFCVDDVSPGDRDFDGLDEEDERIYGTSDTSRDTDGDGYDDASEIQSGYNPNGPGPLAP